MSIFEGYGAFKSLCRLFRIECNCSKSLTDFVHGMKQSSKNFFQLLMKYVPNSEPKYTERKKKRRVEFFPSYFNHFFTVFTIAIHFYRLSCECEPRVYESLVDVLSNQCVKSFNRALHSALHGQYGKPKFRAKQACLNLQHKISSHHLVHFNDTQRSSILLPIFLFIFTLL